MNEVKLMQDIAKNMEKQSTAIDVVREDQEKRKAILESVIKTAANQGLIKDKEVEKAMLEDFAEYAASSDELVNALDEYQTKYTEVMQEQMEEFDKLVKEYDLEEIKARILGYRDQYLEKGMTEKAKECEALLTEMENAVKLNNLKDAIKEIKNPQKILDVYKTKYIKTFEGFRKRLRQNKKYYFIAPDAYLAQLEILLGSQDDAMLFLFHFCRYFISDKTINKNAVFINEFTKNLARSMNPQYINRDEFKQNIMEIVNTLRGI